MSEQLATPVSIIFMTENLASFVEIARDDIIASKCPRVSRFRSNFYLLDATS